MRYRIIASLFFVFSLMVTAQDFGTIRGRVIDAESQKPLEAANITVVGTTIGTHSNENGSYEILRIPEGSYTVRVSYIGYSPIKSNVRIRPGTEVILDVALETTVLPGQSIVVSATRARERESPVAFGTVTARELTERYTVQDIPLLLSELPSTTFYSESGNGIGYNYLSIRGFDQRRISVMINGIPQNDPEDHDVYWLDFPDLAANVQDIQVQRGAGSAFYGPPAIGGSVNLITSGYGRTPGIELTSGFGSFNTRKFAVGVNSGLVSGQYQFYGRLSRILSDGYRKDSWSEFSSYFVGAIRYDKNMIMQFNFYGGPVADHLAYYGIPKDDAYSSDRERRRQNPIKRPEEIENFSQPHYELLHEWQVNEDLILNNAFFAVTGDGFFDFDGSWAPYSYFRITPSNGFPVAGDPDDLYIPQALIRAWVSNLQYGWLPRVSLTHERGTLTVGAEVRFHRSHHWGALRWGEELPAGITPDYHYYEYRGTKTIMSLYAHELYALRPDVTAQLDLQYIYNRYRLYDEKYVGSDIAVPYSFLNPRFGLNYNINEKLNLYAQVSRTSREPRLKNLYDAAEASTPSSWGPVTPQFKVLPNGRYDFSSPLVSAEALLDFELGFGYSGDRFRTGLNLYSMWFDDEIIKKGQLDRFGIPVTGNAEKTIHQGIELTLAASPLDVFEIQGNAALSRNRLQRYTIFGDNGPVSLDGNTIAGFPEFLANVRATYRSSHLTASLALRHVGQFYTDNFQNPAKRDADPGKTVDASTVVNASLNVHLPVGGLLRTLELQLQVNNIFDHVYATHGEGDEFFPGAERNVFASLRFGL